MRFVDDGKKPIEIFDLATFHYASIADAADREASLAVGLGLDRHGAPFKFGRSFYVIAVRPGGHGWAQHLTEAQEPPPQLACDWRKAADWRPELSVVTDRAWLYWGEQHNAPGKSSAPRPLGEALKRMPDPLKDTMGRDVESTTTNKLRKQIASLDTLVAATVDEACGGQGSNPQSHSKPSHTMH